MRWAEVGFKEGRQLIKKKGRSEQQKNSKCLSFKPMNYDRIEWLYVKRSMLKIYHGYWYYNL